MAEHELKTWPGPFGAMWHEVKRFEIRRDDRGFKVWDRLWLREWHPVHIEPCRWVCYADEQQAEREDYHCEICGRRKDEPLPGEYTGRELRGVVVRFILRGPSAEEFGLRPGYCAMSTYITGADCYVRPENYDEKRNWEEYKSFDAL